MDFTLTEEQAILRDSVRRYFDKEAPPGSTGADPEKIWAHSAEMGWLSVMIPIESGGFGGSIIDGCLLSRELGRGRVRSPFVETAILGARTFDNRPAMLQQIADGAVKVASLLHEDLDGPIVYRRTPSGYVLRGAKRFAPLAPGSNVLIIKAFDETGLIPAVFGVRSDASYVRVKPFPTLDRMGAASIAFEPGDIGEDDCLAVGEAARGLVDDLELAGCLAFSAEAVGLMEFLVNATREYAGTRQQFGQPIAGFQVVRHKLVEMYAYLQLAESLVFQAADTFIRLGRAAETFQAVRAAFSCAGRHGRRVGKEAVQLHGAIGTMEEMPIGRALARLVAISQSCGGVSLHERRYAENVASVGDTSRTWAL